MDFKLTRAAIEVLDEPIEVLAADLPRPMRTPLPRGGFRWRYPTQSAEVVQIAKAVRMVTSIRAAWHLAEEGLTTESATLLRVTSDFAAEIGFLAEGILEGKLNSAQQKFVDDYFKPFPTDPDELAAREREYYVGRKDITAAHTRLVQKAGIDRVRYERLVKYLNKGYDAYVHGAYGTAMELFTGATYSFMLRKNESPHANRVAKALVAGKLHEVFVALELMLLTRGHRELVERLSTIRLELHASAESTGRDCPPN
jgi:hypothetical protein